MPTGAMLAWSALVEDNQEGILIHIDTDFASARNE